MKNLLLLTFCFLSLTLVAQQSSDKHTSIQGNLQPDLKVDSLNLHFSFPCIAFDGEFGLEYDYHDDVYYTSSCTSDSIAKYDVDGNLVETFVIPGVGNIRDLAYDGEFFYGGTNDTILYVMDFVTRTLVVAAGMPFKIQSIAYHEDDWVFWVGEEGGSTLYCTDASGVNLGYITIEEYDSINITGMAIEEFELIEDPYLWILCSDSSRTFLFKYDIYENERVGSDIDLTNLVSPDAQTGGLYYDDDWYMYEGYIGGIFQDELVFVFELDYANQLVSTGDNKLPTIFEVYPNPASDKIIVNIAHLENQQIDCRIFDEKGQLLYENRITSCNLEVDITSYFKGTYFVQLIGEEGYSLTKKFQKH